eukprot:TRINITY_DN19698_c0_g2_i1.p1 TRINITY_DN19698_c0_g2~~TRINITY_DN19698_c0_g2_i1.p1  ORF type:complete len:254 (-),score=68.84 TRINITY_DN19698_c0_g2_i1:162-923(-)
MLLIFVFIVTTVIYCFFFFQAEDGIRDAQESRGLGDVYKRQALSGYEDWETRCKALQLIRKEEKIVARAKSVGQNAGLQLIRSALQKWQQFELAAGVAHWSRSCFDDKLWDERWEQRLLSGLRGFVAVFVHWRKRVLMAVILNWRAKRKVCLIREREQRKHEGALEDIQEKVLLMIKHSEERARDKVRAAKMNAEKFELQAEKLAVENRSLRLQLGRLYTMVEAPGQQGEEAKKPKEEFGRRSPGRRSRRGKY